MSPSTGKEKVAALPTLSQIKSLLQFLPVFGERTSAHSKWRVKPGEFPWCSLSESASNFYRALYDEGFVIHFAWGDWQEEGLRYVHNPQLLNAATLRTICQLITMHVRKDRFCEGYFASQFANGHIAAILHRLAAIERELSTME